MHRSLKNGQALAAIGAAFAMTGCLVSEEPILDERNGRATPLKEGEYISCPVEKDVAGDDCDRHRLLIADDKTSLFVEEDADEEDAAQMRFRRIGRRGYAVQSFEGDSYTYYYGAGDSDKFRLTMMLCSDLPAELRTRLIDRGHLTAEDEEFETCVVNDLRGLTDAAKAYHRGDIVSGEEIVLEFTPAPA